MCTYIDAYVSAREWIVIYEYTQEEGIFKATSKQAHTKTEKES